MGLIENYIKGDKDYSKRLVKVNNLIKAIPLQDEELETDYFGIYMYDIMFSNLSEDEALRNIIKDIEQKLSKKKMKNIIKMNQIELVLIAENPFVLVTPTAGNVYCGKTKKECYWNVIEDEILKE